MPLLLETQENVTEKFRQGIMAKKKKKVKVTEVKEEEEDGEKVEGKKRANLHPSMLEGLKIEWTKLVERKEKC